MTDDARTRLWTASRRATRILSGERPLTMAERLTTLAAAPLANGRPDAYGNGVVEVLEQRVAELLGKPAALWFPTGTMAQQAVLRVWAERAGTPRVALHPAHHNQVHEEDAGHLLTGLEPVFPTTEPRHPTAEELDATPGPLAAAVHDRVRFLVGDRRPPPVGGPRVADLSCLISELTEST
ncbi:beta-eliminating lyase-related protein [Tersicoccus sp. MR15.9]|uniref:beta-eliminating lyase-related protein n=1 Tax=Tersicoccus mangrovi TaxID=3121635 RepID=UPI002FE54454